MVLPDKYVSLAESYIGVSALLLDILGDKKITVDKLWDKFVKKYVKTNEIKSIPTYQKYIYVLEFMYMAKMINYNEKGEMYNENLKS
ncbi:ABC-three component system middle component 6 [Lachnospiraceae bacterium LCP25S3_G4]